MFIPRIIFARRPSEGTAPQRVNRRDLRSAILIAAIAALAGIAGCANDPPSSPTANLAPARHSDESNPADNTSSAKTAAGRTKGPSAAQAAVNSAAHPATNPANLPSLSAPTSEIVARVGAHEITYGQLEKPLIDSYGLNVLLQLAQLDLARQNAANAHVTVTPQDIKNEQELTLKLAFPDADPADYPALLKQLLDQQHVSQAEYNIVIEINACLRKIAAPSVAANVTEEKIAEAFGVLYGERVQVRHIQLSTLQQVAEAKRRLAAGEPFEKVAQEMSENQVTRENQDQGGLLPPFSRAQRGPDLSDAFKDAAFDLKVGEVSDAVHTGDSYQIIQLVKRIPPNTVKLADQHDFIKDRLTQSLSQQAIKELRSQLGRQVVEYMRIEDPALRAQFEERLNPKKEETKTQNDTESDVEKLRQRIHHQEAPPPETPATQAAPAPAPAPSPVAPQNLPPPQLKLPATSPSHAPHSAGSKASVRPPATKPAPAGTAQP